MEKVRVLFPQISPQLSSWNSQTNKPSGLLPELFQEIVSKDLAIEIVHMGPFPLARSYEYLNNGKADLYVGLIETPERKQQVVFSDAVVLRDRRILIFRRSSKTKTPKENSDLKGKSIGVAAGMLVPDLLKEKEFEKSLKTLAATNHFEQALKMVASDRLDYFFYPSGVAAALALIDFGQVEQLSIVPFPDDPPVQFRIGFSKNFPEETRKKIDKVFLKSNVSSLLRKQIIDRCTQKLGHKGCDDLI